MHEWPACVSVVLRLMCGFSFGFQFYYNVKVYNQFLDYAVLITAPPLGQYVLTTQSFVANGAIFAFAWSVFFALFSLLICCKQPPGLLLLGTADLVVACLIAVASARQRDYILYPYDQCQGADFDTATTNPRLLVFHRLQQANPQTPNYGKKICLDLAGVWWQGPGVAVLYVIIGVCCLASGFSYFNGRDSEFSDSLKQIVAYSKTGVNSLARYIRP